MSRQRSTSGEGVRVAEELTERVDEKIEHLEDLAGIPHTAAEAAAPPEAEAATIYYFAFGSNIARKVFQGRRMIRPAESTPAVLHGYKLVFLQPGLPYTEPGFASVEPVPTPSSSNGSAPLAAPPSAAADAGAGNGPLERRPDVHGVAHRITPSEWAYVCETEGAASPKGDNRDGGSYKVIEVEVETYDGRRLNVYTLTSAPATVARLRGCEPLPSQRYLSIIREGAEESGLAPEYRAWLATLRHYEPRTLGQKVGALLFSSVGFVFLFPVFGATRLWRRLTGLQAAGAPRAMAFYFRLLLSAVWRMHWALQPLLGSGTSAP